MRDLRPYKKGFKVVGEKIVNLSLKPYQVTIEEFQAARGKRLNLYQTYDYKGPTFNFVAKYFILGSYDEFDPCHIIRNGDNVELKKYIWEKL